MKKLIVTNFYVTIINILILVLLLWVIEEYNKEPTDVMGSISTFMTMLWVVTLIPVGVINILLFTKSLKVNWEKEQDK